MKRILLIVIPIFIGIIIGVFFLGKILFGKYEYHISKEQTFEIWRSTERNTNDRTLKIYEDGELVNEILITTFQIPKINKSKVVMTRRYKMSYGGLFVFLYIVLIIGVILFFISQIYDLKCYFGGKEETYGYCKSCENRNCSATFKCKLYKRIEDYDLTSYKKKFKLFWGY